MTPHITASLDALIGTITLNKADKRNVLSESLIQEVIAALAAFRERRVRVVVLRAQPGAKVWSAEHDVEELPIGGRDPLAGTTRCAS